MRNVMVDPTERTIRAIRNRTPSQRFSDGVAFALTVITTLLVWLAVPPAPNAPPSVIDKGPRPDSPGEAARFRLLSLVDENGRLAMDGLTRAHEQIRRMRDFNAVSPMPAAGISRGSWTSIGPGNIGGRVRALVVHPTATATLFAGSVAGGLWKTTNGGTTWAPVDDFMANLAISSIIYQPGNPSIMYAATGEGFYNGDGVRGNGIFKSINGGTSWAQLGTTNTSSFFYVNRLAASANGNTILAATRNGIRRSLDGGASWTAPLATETTDVRFIPGSSLNAVASGYGGNAWYSFDAGASWIPASGLPAGSFRRVELAPSPSAEGRVYAVVDVLSGSVRGELYRSDNFGISYSLVSTPGHLFGQGRYDNTIWVDPTNPDIVVVGGIDLYRSTNGGVTFTQISSLVHSRPSPLTRTTTSSSTIPASTERRTDASISATTEACTVPTTYMR